MDAKARSDSRAWNMKVEVDTNHFLIIALTSIRDTIYTISSNTMESIYMDKIYENKDNSEKC